jgi:hypothetical protein
MSSSTTPDIDPSLHVQVVNNFFRPGHVTATPPEEAIKRQKPVAGVQAAYEYISPWTRLLFTGHAPAADKLAKQTLPAQEKPSDIHVTRVKNK